MVRNVDENSITAEVLSRIEHTPDPRLRQIMTALIRHLHDFAREVHLTEEEWFQGIQFLTDTGHITTDKRQEFIMLSDTLGLSMLVIAQNNRKPPGCTEATVFGPFHVDDPPVVPLGADIGNGAEGEDCYVDATVRGLSGEAVAGAAVDVWQSDAAGFYDVQYDDGKYRARGLLHTDKQGRVYFKSILPVAYSIPHDGTVGRMIEATGRHPWRPAHMHFMITAPGYERLVTHVFRDDDRYLESDVVFGVRSSLVTHWDRHEAGALAPNGQRADKPFYTLKFEFVLNPLPERPK